MAVFARQTGVATVPVTPVTKSTWLFPQLLVELRGGNTESFRVAEVISANLSLTIPKLYDEWNVLNRGRVRRWLLLSVFEAYPTYLKSLTVAGIYRLEKEKSADRVKILVNRIVRDGIAKMQGAPGAKEKITGDLKVVTAELVRDVKKDLKQLFLAAHMAIVFVARYDTLGEGLLTNLSDFESKFAGKVYNTITNKATGNSVMLYVNERPAHDKRILCDFANLVTIGISLLTSARNNQGNLMDGAGLVCDGKAFSKGGSPKAVSHKTRRAVYQVMSNCTMPAELINLSYHLWDDACDGDVTLQDYATHVVGKSPIVAVFKRTLTTEMTYTQFQALVPGDVSGRHLTAKEASDSITYIGMPHKIVETLRELSMGDRIVAQSLQYVGIFDDQTRFIFAEKIFTAVEEPFGVDPDDELDEVPVTSTSVPSAAHDSSTSAADTTCTQMLKRDSAASYLTTKTTSSDRRWNDQFVHYMLFELSLEDRKDVEVERFDKTGVDQALKRVSSCNSDDSRGEVVSTSSCSRLSYQPKRRELETCFMGDVYQQSQSGVACGYGFEVPYFVPYEAQQAAVPVTEEDMMLSAHVKDWLFNDEFELRSTEEQSTFLELNCANNE
jgi:hypothetical protein